MQKQGQPGAFKEAPGRSRVESVVLFEGHAVDQPERPQQDQNMVDRGAWHGEDQAAGRRQQAADLFGQWLQVLVGNMLEHRQHGHRVERSAWRLRARQGSPLQTPARPGKRLFDQRIEPQSLAKAFAQSLEEAGVETTDVEHP